MRAVLPFVLWHAFCTAKHFAKFYARYGFLPPGPVTSYRYAKARLAA